jgi:hypothetical protein
MITNYKRYLIMLILLPMISGCYLPMTGTIIDAETKAPIEGAVVLVEWTKTKGVGFTYTESYKVAEILSDKEGKFKLPGCLCIATEDPDITIYKKGYVAWNNKFEFPNYNKRTNFMWGTSSYEISRISAGFSKERHIAFIHTVIHLGLGQKKLISEATREEEREALGIGPH